MKISARGRIIIIIFALSAFHYGLYSQCIQVDSVTPVCLGAAAVLNSSLQPGCLNGTTSYTFETFPFAPQPLVKDTAVDPNFMNDAGVLTGNHDDTWAGPYPIGFRFCFLNNTFREYWIGSNGWISFTNPKNKGWTIFTPFTIPSTNNAVPKNAIFAPYQDWNPSTGGPSRPKVYRHLVLDPPNNNKLVIYWDSCALYNCSSAIGVFQIVLNESDYSIENNITVKPSCGWQSNSATQGVHNDDGTIAFTVFNRNASSWTTDHESTKFVPNGITWYKDAFPGGTIVGYGPSITVNPVVTTNYFAVTSNCLGADQSARVNVRVLPSPTLSGPATACLNSVEQYTTQAGKLQYQWSVSAGGLISGGGGASDDYAQVTWNSGGPGMVSVIYTEPSGGCTSVVPGTLSVTVKQLPDVMFTPVNPLLKWCSGDMVEVNLSSSFAGATFTWSSSANPAAINPPTVINQSGNIRHAYTNSSFTMQNVDFQAEATADGCTSNPFPYTVQIYPVPNVLVSMSSQNTCSGGSSIPVTLSSAVTGANYTWSYPCGAGSVTPCPASGAGNTLPSVVLNNSANTAKSVIYTAQAFVDGCPGTFGTHTVNVNPKPAVANSSMSQNVCLGTTSSVVNLTCTVIPASFQWSAMPSHPSITGYTTGTQSTPIIPPQPLNDPLNVNGYVTYTIIPSINLNSLTCQGDAAAYVINTRTAPIVTITGPTPSLACEGQSNTFSVPPDPGTVFTWGVNPSPMGTITSPQGLPDVTVQWNGNGNGIQANVSAISIYGCTATSSSSFLIRPMPLVSMDLCIDPITTPDARPYILRGGRPFGTTGTYSGNGVSLVGSHYEFNPASIVPPLPQTISITYTYINIYGCPGSNSKTVQVISPPSFVCGSSISLLQDVRTTPRRTYTTSFRGGSCWMTMNLDYGTSVSSTQTMADNCIPGKIL